MYYDLGCIRVGKSYIKLEEDLHISSIARLTTETIIKPQSGKVCLCRVKGNEQVLNSKLYQVIAAGNITVSQEPGLILVNSIMKVTKQGKFLAFIINNTNKKIKLKQGSKIGKVEPIRECDFVNINNYSRPKKSTSPKVSSFTEVKQNINTLPSFQDIVEELLRYILDLFTEKDTELGKMQTVKKKIDIGYHKPIKLKSYRTPFTKRPIVDKAIDDLLAANVIQPSRSSWDFPKVIVDKKDGLKRFCTDFRKLNFISKKSSWSLPVIDDMLAVLGKAEFFPTLDLKSGYWQIPIDENDKEKTALTCHRSLYEYKFMPFGLANTPGIFQELMPIVLQDLGNLAMAYLDDIIILIHL